MAKKKTPKKKTSQRNKKQEPAQQNFWQRLSINRRLDLIGTVLALLGLLTFLTLASITRSSFTDLWVVFLMRAFGWGEWFFPAGLIIIGVWLVARNQENIPHISIERVTGLSLLFFWLLAIFQLLTVNPIQEVPFIEGRIGGGYLGALFMRVLWGNFGGLGTTVIFLAWLLIGMTMVLDLSIHEFFERISPPFMMVYQIWKERLAEARAARFPEKEMPSVQMNGYTKIEGRPDSVSTPQVQLGVPAEQPI